MKTFRVRGLVSVVSLAFSVVGLFMVCAPAYAQTHTFTLTWQDNATNEDGTRVERCANSGCTNFVEIFSIVGADLVSFKDTVANTGAGNITYRYRVRAFNAQGFSPYSNIADGVTPAVAQPPNGAPSNLEISALSSESIQLSWQDNSTNETGQLVRWRSWAPPKEGEIMLAANTTGLIMEGLKKNTPHCAQIYALNGAAESAASNEACAVTLKR